MSALLYGSFESFLTPYGLLIDSEHVCQSRHRTSRTPRDTALRLSKPSFSHTYENPLSPAITPFPQHNPRSTHEHSPLNDDEPDQSRFSPVLGENVRRMRSYSNITKTRLALMVSIGRPLLNRIEDGTADVRLSVVTKLADSLATTPSFLLAKHSDEDIRHEIAHRKASSPVAAVRHARFY